MSDSSLRPHVNRGARAFFFEAPNHSLPVIEQQLSLRDMVSPLTACEHRILHIALGLHSESSSSIV